MSTIDVRSGDEERIKSVVFADDHSGYYASKLQLTNNWDGKHITFEDSDGDDAYKLNLEDIDNMILALQKAKELWGDM